MTIATRNPNAKNGLFKYSDENDIIYPELIIIFYFPSQNTTYQTTEYQKTKAKAEINAFARFQILLYKNPDISYHDHKIFIKDEIPTSPTGLFLFVLHREIR